MRPLAIFALKAFAVIMLTLGILTGITAWQGTNPHIDYGTATHPTGRIAAYNTFYDRLLTTTTHALGPGTKIIPPAPDGPGTTRSSHLYGYNTYTLLPDTAYNTEYKTCPPGQGILRATGALSTPTKPTTRATQVITALHAAGYTTHIANQDLNTTLPSITLTITRNGFTGSLFLVDAPNGNATSTNYVVFTHAADTRKPLANNPCLPLNTLPAPR